MSLAMTKDEREAFLTGVHVGIIGIADGDRGPLTTPLWYAYEPEGDVRIVIDRTSRKAQLLARVGRFSLCAQNESLPYKYVSVEGPVVSSATADVERDVRPLARRYLGTARGDEYIERTRSALESDGLLIRMRPERWLTVDYAKLAR
jgi:hypothetical protein